MDTSGKRSGFSGNRNKKIDSSYEDLRVKLGFALTFYRENYIMSTIIEERNRTEHFYGSR